MVLQRDQPLPIWGSSKPGDEITASFAEQTASTQANADGHWKLKLAPVTASTSARDLVIHSALEKQDVKITDILVGDVWLCSGQSNMHFQMKSTYRAPEEIAAANHPSVRYLTVEHQFVQTAAQDTLGTWKSLSPQTAADCSAVACYFGMALQQKLGVPIGLLVSSVGGTRIETWMRPETLAATGESRTLVQKWAAVSPDEFQTIGTTYSEFQRQRDQVHPQAVKAAKAKGEPPPAVPQMPKLRCHDCPSALHNGMIAPLQSFAIRGAIWYQGESNSGQATQYEKLLPAMIADWRQVWGKELPFLFVQLAPHRSIHPAFRESQQRIWQSTPHSAMVVTTDVGDAGNIHPTRKRPVGERLALAARAVSYGERIEYSGPVCKGMSITGSTATLSFTHLGSGLMVKGDKLKGFTISAANGNFVPAEATIEADTIIVTAPKISVPTAVRYGWSQVPEVNLFCKEGLPAAPFRTDSPKPGIRQ
jgi:sialate O-acetylesterase